MLYHFLMRLNIERPYDDENLRFDGKSGRYVLTFEYAKAHFPPNFKDDETLKLRLEANSRKIYNFLHYRGYAQNRKAMDFMLNETKEGRDFLLALLSEQMEADVASGFNDLSSIPAVNPANGNVIDREQLRANQISVDAEQIVDDSAAWFGIPITLRQRYPWYYLDLAKGGL